MKINIFFSWQSDTSADYNSRFISDALKEAKKLLKKETKKIEYSDIEIDRDTKKIPGSPNIPQTLDDKIRSCQVFVGDLTVINQNYLISKIIPDKVIRPRLNENVLYEYGKAEAIVSSKSIINVFNEHYHKLEEQLLPFDIQQNRWPIRYNYSKKLINKREEILTKLARQLADAIKLIVEDRIQNPQSPNYPFLEWEQWTRELGETLSIPFESNEVIDSKIATLTKGVNKEKSILRLVGLSGLGKTRLVYEAFNPARLSKNLEIAQDILYFDLNTGSNYRDQLFALSENGDRKIIILDNCDRQTLAQVTLLVKKSSSKLSIIAIDHNVPVSMLDHSSESTNIDLKHEDFESIIDNILLKVFPSSSEASERLLIKQFAKGHTLIATILAQDKKIEKSNWRPIITRAGVLEKILGEFGTRAEERKVLRAVSIFDKLGHFDELVNQTEFVANSDLLTNLIPGDKTDAFKQVCKHYLNKGIMERQARFVIIRTRPIALSLAVEWWENCEAEKAKKVFDSLEKQTELKLYLTEQLKYLDFLENARDVVAKFVAPSGPFGTAEVLNTEEGSRLFRAFVEVNPEECVKTLERTFQNKSKEELINIDKGRRNLVWALEMLCFRVSTFERAAKVLLDFSIAENEDMISNNSTGQFLQLFQAFLPGTQANYDERILIIEFALSRGDEYERLGFLALKRGLKSRDFHRGGGAEDQGSGPPLKDYPQTEEEAAKVDGYWKYCIERLFKFALNEGKYSQAAREALVHAIRAFCSVNAGHLILPIIEKLLNHKADDWHEIRSNLKLTLKYDKHSLGKTNEELINTLLSRLNPKDFASLYVQFVKSPRWDDDEDGFAGMRVQAQKLAVHFVGKEYDFKYLPDFFTGEQQNGGWFGEEIANQLSDEKSKEFFSSSVNAIHSIEKEKYDLAVLVGFIRGTKNEDLKTEYLRKLFYDPHFENLSFVMSSMANPPLDIYNDLLEMVKSNKFPITEFLRFQYGRALDHLKSDDVLNICKQISDHSIEGSKTVVSILYMYCYNNEANWEKSKGLIRQLLEVKGLLKYSEEAAVDKHKWEDLCERFLKNGDEKFAVHLINEIVDLCGNDMFVSSVDYELKAILKLLIKDYFDVIWPFLNKALLSVDGDFLYYFNLRNLLTSHIGSFGSEVGVIFLGDLDKIYEWCLANRPLAANRLANMMPIFHETEHQKWHPFATRLIDEFGDDDDFINKLDANINSYSWSGSIVPLLMDKKILFESLKDHKYLKVREWALNSITYLDERIRRETNEDVERYL